MNTDSRGENRAHAQVAPDYFGAAVSNALPTPLATDSGSEKGAFGFTALQLQRLHSRMS
jgi:hypothetical protein